jgi:hypothetical protein
MPRIEKLTLLSPVGVMSSSCTTRSNAGVRNAINSLASSAKGLLLHSELRRELFTARRGRRDAVAVLRSALKAARELIYIETRCYPR